MSDSRAIPYAKPCWKDEEAKVLLDVLGSGHWTSGRYVMRLEDRLKSLLKECSAIAVANGTLGLLAIFHCIKQPGRNLMISSSLNFTAAASTARLLGYDIALTDVSSNCLTMAPTSLEYLLSRFAPKYDNIVISPVHYAGVSCDMTAITNIAQKFGAHVIEDACHALGALYRNNETRVGTHPASLASVFSFHPNKPVAAGEGGAIVTRNLGLLKKLRNFRNHNMDRPLPEKYWECQISEPGLNLRLSEFHASLATVQLARLLHNTDIRRDLASAYLKHLPQDPRIHLVGANWHHISSHHLFPIRLVTNKLSREEVHAIFSRHHVKPQLLYIPLHQQPAFKNEPLVKISNFSASERLAEELYCLPLFVDLTRTAVKQVVSAVQNVLDEDNQ